MAAYAAALEVRPYAGRLGGAAIETRGARSGEALGLRLTTGPPARAAVSGPRRNRPRPGGALVGGVVEPRKQQYQTMVRAGSEALNVIWKPSSDRGTEEQMKRGYPTQPPQWRP